MLQVDGAGSDGLVGPGVACWVGISGASDAWEERACRHGGSSAIRNRKPCQAGFGVPSFFRPVHSRLK